jgi:hypothetical protein
MIHQQLKDEVAKAAIAFDADFEQMCRASYDSMRSINR